MGAIMRALTLLALAALAGAPAWAQNSQQNTAQRLPDGREQLLQQEQKNSDGGPRIQHITVEDAGSRVDELRVGGQTQSITVQPKTATRFPSYEVRPEDGVRVWNLRRF